MRTDWPSWFPIIYFIVFVLIAAVWGTVVVYMQARFLNDEPYIYDEAFPPDPPNTVEFTVELAEGTLIWESWTQEWRDPLGDS